MSEPTEETENPKDKKKLLLIIGVAVVALAIGAAATFLMIGGKGDGEGKSPETHAAKTEESKPAAGGHGGGEGEAAGAGNVNAFGLEPFIVNIYDGEEIRYLKVKVEFELANPSVKTELEAKTAPLRDAILILLTTKTMQEIQDLQGKNHLRDQILVAVNKIITPGDIKKVFFTDFVVQ